MLLERLGMKSIPREETCWILMATNRKGWPMTAIGANIGGVKFK